MKSHSLGPWLASPALPRLGSQLHLGQGGRLSGRPQPARLVGRGLSSPHLCLHLQDTEGHSAPEGYDAGPRPQDNCFRKRQPTLGPPPPDILKSAFPERPGMPCPATAEAGGEALGSALGANLLPGHTPGRPGPCIHTSASFSIPASHLNAAAQRRGRETEAGQRTTQQATGR